MGIFVLVMSRRENQQRTSQGLATLPDVLGVERLDLGPPGLLLGLDLNPLDLLARLTDLATRQLQRTVSVAFRRLGTHDAFAGLDDAGVELLVAVDAEFVQETGSAGGPVVARAGLRRAVGGGRVVGCLCGVCWRWRGVSPE